MTESAKKAIEDATNKYAGRWSKFSREHQAVEQDGFEAGAKFGYQLGYEEAMLDTVRTDYQPFQICPKCDGLKIIRKDDGMDRFDEYTCHICNGQGVIPMASGSK